MRDRGEWLLVALLQVTAFAAATEYESSYLYYPQMDMYNVLSPMNLCEQLCGQCGCNGLFLEDDVCQCSCDSRSYDPAYANCTMGMMQVCDESDVDCEFPEEQQYGERARTARGKCMECHEEHHHDECDHDCHHHHDHCDLHHDAKKFLCCKHKCKKHKHKKHKKHRKIHIKIKGVLPDCCYFQNHDVHHHHHEEKKEEKCAEKKAEEKCYEAKPEEKYEAPKAEEKYPEPAYEKEPEYAHEEYEEAKPQQCCHSGPTGIHCDNCHIYHGQKEASHMPGASYKLPSYVPSYQEATEAQNEELSIQENSKPQKEKVPTYVIYSGDKAEHQKDFVAPGHGHHGGYGHSYGPPPPVYAHPPPSYAHPPLNYGPLPPNYGPLPPMYVPPPPNYGPPPPNYGPPLPPPSYGHGGGHGYSESYTHAGGHGHSGGHGCGHGGSSYGHSGAGYGHSCGHGGNNYHHSGGSYGHSHGFGHGQTLGHSLGYNNGGDDGGDQESGQVVEYSHHKVTIPGDHIKPIIDRLMEQQEQVPTQHPIDLTIYNQIVNHQLWDAWKRELYSTLPFAPTPEPLREHVEPPAPETSPIEFPPAPPPPPRGEDDYLPIIAPLGSFVEPVYEKPAFFAGPDTGPAVFEQMEDSPPPTEPPPPLYVQQQSGNYFPFSRTLVGSPQSSHVLMPVSAYRKSQTPQCAQ